jgi:hypothetical protein
MRLAVAHDVREVPLHRPLALLQFRQRTLLRFESGDRAEPVVEHPLVGRITVDKVGADIENAGRSRTPHQIAKEQRRCHLRMIARAGRDAEIFDTPCDFIAQSTADRCHRQHDAGHEVCDDFGAVRRRDAGCAGRPRRP